MCDPDTVAPMTAPPRVVELMDALAESVAAAKAARRARPLGPDFTIPEVVQAFSRWLGEDPHADQG